MEIYYINIYKKNKIKMDVISKLKGGLYPCRWVLACLLYGAFNLARGTSRSRGIMPLSDKG